MGRKHKINDVDFRKIAQLYRYGFGVLSITYVMPYRITPETVYRTLKTRGVTIRTTKVFGRYVRRGEVLDARVNWKLPFHEFAHIYPENGLLTKEVESGDVVNQGI
jgi:hypothetical protein